MSEFVHGLILWSGVSVSLKIGRNRGYMGGDLRFMAWDLSDKLQLVFSEDNAYLKSFWDVFSLPMPL